MIGVIGIGLGNRGSLIVYRQDSSGISIIKHITSEYLLCVFRGYVTDVQLGESTSKGRSRLQVQHILPGSHVR
jgi:hypothetical protein